MIYKSMYAYRSVQTSIFVTIAIIYFYISSVASIWRKLLMKINIQKYTKLKLKSKSYW